MADLSGAEQFECLSGDQKAQYLKVSRQMVHLAQEYSVPIIYGPRVSAGGGVVNGATGCVLKLQSGTFLVTASHVLAGYEKRVGKGETLNWQVGKLRPFDPLQRIAWRDVRKDIVFLRLRRDEVEMIGPVTAAVPPRWPPPHPQQGQLVVLAGFPGNLREVNFSGWIGAGPFSAVFRVTTTGEDYCTCRIEQKELISFTDAAPPPPGTDMGGISGGPVLLMGELNYPLVGIITDLGYMEFADLELLRIATFENAGVD
jgi:hypothetical protein